MKESGDVLDDLARRRAESKEFSALVVAACAIFGSAAFLVAGVVKLAKAFF